MADEADPEELLAQVADRAELREGAEGVRRLLLALYRQRGAGVRPLAREVGLPIPVAVAVLGELEQEDLVVRHGGTDGVGLTDAGLTLAESLGFRGRPVPSTYPAALPEPWRDVLGTVEKAAARRGPADTTRDQAFATPETALRRALVLLATGALEGRRVLFVGDGDLVSVACRAVGGAEALAVVDSDARLGELLPEPIAFHQADLRDGLPDALHGAFDVAVTDPPYTVAGARLFVSRGLEGLADGPGRTVLLSYARADPDARLHLQATLASMGLALRALIPGFNRYEGAHVLAGQGDLYHLETTGTARPALEGAFEGAIYTGEDRPTRRCYVCTDCGETVEVGSVEGAAHATVEALKAAGCPACGGDGFRLEERSVEEPAETGEEP